jgi:hypothetical protein
MLLSQSKLVEQVKGSLTKLIVENPFVDLHVVRDENRKEKLCNEVV